MNILVFGSLNLDFVMAVDHIIAPGETQRINQMEIHPGGKGMNQAIAIARAGHKVTMAGNVGQTDGQLLLDMLDRYGVDRRLVKSVSGLSGAAYIQVDANGQNCILIAANANSQNTLAGIEAILDEFNAGDIILLQNEINLLAQIVEQAARRGLEIYLNPSPFNELLDGVPLEKVNCFILNEIEGLQLTGESDPKAILARIHERFPEAGIVLTLGADGAVYSDGVETLYQKAYPVKTVDTTAAGDTFTGYLLAEIARGSDVKSALDLAAKAAAIVTTRPGAASSIPTLDEVEG